MKTITRQELKAKLDTGQDIKLVMTVGGWTFRARHIPGSRSFPSPSCALRELRRDDEIIVYSTSPHRQDTVAAFDALTAHGYRNVCCYTGGLADWEDAGYPVEGDSVASATTHRWPHGHSPRGLELDGGCPHCDNGLVGLRLATGGNHRSPTPGRSATPDDRHGGCTGWVVRACSPGSPDACAAWTGPMKVTASRSCSRSRRSITPAVDRGRTDRRLPPHDPTAWRWSGITAGSNQVRMRLPPKEAQAKGTPRSRTSR